jgi:hypothetical protein
MPDSGGGEGVAIEVALSCLGAGLNPKEPVDGSVGVSFSTGRSIKSGTKPQAQSVAPECARTEGRQSSMKKLFKRILCPIDLQDGHLTTTGSEIFCPTCAANIRAGGTKTSCPCPVGDALGVGFSDTCIFPFRPVTERASWSTYPAGDGSTATLPNMPPNSRRVRSPNLRTLACGQKRSRNPEKADSHRSAPRRPDSPIARKPSSFSA